MNHTQFYAVLTGDIIRSRNLSNDDLNSVRTTLQGAVVMAKQWDRGDILGDLEFFRGDTWQMLLAQPHSALRVGIFLRASLLAGGKADSRISVGLGQVANIAEKQISLSTGEAFSLSGHGLDNMTQYSTLTIEAPKSVGPLVEWLRVVAHLCDAIIGQWTERQAEIVCLAIDPEEPTQEEMAQKLTPAVSRQTVTKALNGANWQAIRDAVRQFEKTPWMSLLVEE